MKHTQDLNDVFVIRDHRTDKLFIDDDCFIRPFESIVDRGKLKDMRTKYPNAQVLTKTEG